MKAIQNCVILALLLYSSSSFVKAFECVSDETEAAEAAKALTDAAKEETDEAAVAADADLEVAQENALVVADFIVMLEEIETIINDATEQKVLDDFALVELRETAEQAQADIDANNLKATDA